MVVGAYKKPWDDTDRSLLNLSYQAFAALAQTYLKKDFVVVADYVWELKDLQELLPLFAEDTKLINVFLLPNLELNLQRNKNRKYPVPKERVVSYVKKFEHIKHKNFGFFTSNGNNVEEEAKSLVNLKPTVIREVLSILNQYKRV